ncbi:protein phosphatase PP2A 55 kDa regulatory subunit-like [Diaphorina citri]|uniref:Protein phosphatase PP2A 55 kDa regulatory subunit-like n=1 Tax=Diaphorina citri TaxID=121845 RepID=A0A3Q0IYL8_DIACI|nr:protein phosphatase PP2A 55 kDa regulatory subunit-like [Diaphorina citri]
MTNTHTKEENGQLRDPSNITALRVPQIKPIELTVEASPRRIFANAHTYHINSISVNSDQETYLSADDLRINLWHLEITDQSFNIVDIKPTNMEELNEVREIYYLLLLFLSIEASPRRIFADAHTYHINSTSVNSDQETYLSADDLRINLWHLEITDQRNFMFWFLNHLCVKVWDLHMESRPVETYPVS